MNRHLHQLLIHTLPVTIRGKLILFFGLSIVVLFALMGTINYFGLPFGLYGGEYRKGKTAAIQRLKVIADDKKGDIVRWFDHRLAGVRLCIDDPIRMANLRNFASSFRSEKGVAKPDERLEDWLSSFMDAFQYDAIEIVDSVSGSHIFSTEQDQSGTECQLYGELFSGGTDWTNKIFFGKGGNEKKGFLYIAHLDKVATDNGVSQFPPVAILFRINMENPYLMSIIHGSELFGETGEIVLVDMQKRLMAPLKYNLPDGTVARVFDHQLSFKAAEFAAWGIDGVIESEDYRGLPIIAAVRHYRVTPDFGLGIIVKQDEKEIFAPLRNGFYASVAIISTGLIALLGIMYLLSTALLKPLETLSSVVYRIESGDLDARVTAESKDECGILAKAFNQMAEKIQRWHEEFESQVNAQTEEIRALNTELEQRVKDRTEQLEASNKELEAFCYSVSHDLRAPLRHIDGYVDLLVSRCRDGLDEKGMHYVDTIAYSARQMGVLIDDLLQFSRTGRTDMRREKLDMNKALNDVLAQLKDSSSGRTIEWIIADLPSVRGDYALLRQVWANLLGNAVKYTRTREIARIEVSARKEKGEIIFVVADNGVGFDMQYSEKLFGVFQRLHNLKEFEGTGIGLATVQRIINRHGGRVWAEAELDRGARFYFSLPK